MPALSKRQALIRNASSYSTQNQCFAHKNVFFSVRFVSGHTQKLRNSKKTLRSTSKLSFRNASTAISWKKCSAKKVGFKKMYLKTVVISFPFRWIFCVQHWKSGLGDVVKKRQGDERRKLVFEISASCEHMAVFEWPRTFSSFGESSTRRKHE